MRLSYIYNIDPSTGTERPSWYCDAPGVKVLKFNSFLSPWKNLQWPNNIFKMVESSH